MSFFRHNKIFPILIATVLFAGITQNACASPTLRQGASGHEVFLLQKTLAQLGYSISAIDGVFGPQTEKAVSDFQRDNKIKITGVVNNSTWRALQTADKKNGGKAADKKIIPTATKAVTPKGGVTNLIKTAKKYIGTPYSFGGTTPKAFDCSGYLWYVFREHGVNLPRSADEQYKLGVPVKNKKDLLPGDLVFFSTYEQGASHVGIYLGKNEFIHASSSKGIRIDDMDNSYWQPRFYGAKRLA